ncbi:hypothetical protein [Echinicola rosea]|nr:hypothetical protein [Echinicola rosea]
MIGWNAISPGFWWATVGLLLLYYAIVLLLLFGPAYLLGKWWGRGVPRPHETQMVSEENLSKAFREYAQIYQRIERPRFSYTTGKLLVPSHIQLDMLTKEPFCRAVERENAKPSQHDKQPTQ